MIDGLTAKQSVKGLSFSLLVLKPACLAQSHQLGSRYRHGQRHIRQSLITNQGETCAPIKSPSSLRRVSQLGARDARVSPREELNDHALRDTQFAPSGHGKR